MKYSISFASGEKLFKYFAVFHNVKNVTQNMQISFFFFKFNLILFFYLFFLLFHHAFLFT